MCQKPWSCHPWEQPDDTQHLCLTMHAKWHQLREHLERQHGLTEQVWYRYGAGVQTCQRVNVKSGSDLGGSSYFPILVGDPMSCKVIGLPAFHSRANSRSQETHPQPGSHNTPTMQYPRRPSLSGHSLRTTWATVDRASTGLSSWTPWWPHTGMDKKNVGLWL